MLTTLSYYKTIFHEYKLFDPTLFMVIYGYFQIFGYFWLFHPRLLLVVLNYFWLFYVISGYWV
jgi:hypothetical protein